MKYFFIPLIITSSFLNAQIVPITEPVTGSGIGIVSNSVTGVLPASATLEFATNGGNGTVSANGIFTGVAGGGGTLLSFARNSIRTAAGDNTLDGSSTLSLTFDSAGEYTISLLDFDVTTANPSLFTVEAGFTSFTTGAGAAGITNGGTFSATQSGNTFSINTLDSGVNGAGSTNGFISLTYDVVIGQTLSFDFQDVNNLQEALAYRITQNNFIAPEPSLSVLLGLGTLTLLVRRRR